MENPAPSNPVVPGWDVSDLTRPLDVFYAEAGLSLPPLEPIDGAAVPQPLRRLLVHRNDMTPTLEAYYGQTIRLRVLRRRLSGDEYCREVALLLADTGEPVEFGANRIRLDRFPLVARQAILDEREPLGHIMRDFRVAHTCEPNAFIRVASDLLIGGALNLRGVHVLFGRHNRLFNPAGELISEVVEILRPPVPNAKPANGHDPGATV